MQTRRQIVRNSTFRNFTGDQACIQILTWKQGLNEPAVRLVCDGNVFENNSCRAISESRDLAANFHPHQNPDELGWYVERSDSYTLENNIQRVGTNVSQVNHISNHNHSWVEFSMGNGTVFG